jgi:hypothetical protein
VAVEAAGFDLPDHLAPVNFWHEHVQDQPVVSRRFELFQGVGAPGCGLDVKAVGHKDHAFKPRDVFLVFDHEEFHGESPPESPRPAGPMPKSSDRAGRPAHTANDQPVPVRYAARATVSTS